VMKAEKTRTLISCVPKEISDSMGGFGKAIQELNQLEASSEIGDAFLWGLKEGLFNNISLESLVKKYREGITPDQRRDSYVGDSIGAVPKECFEAYGNDLDGCSTQSNEGCSRCNLLKRGE